MVQLYSAFQCATVPAAADRELQALASGHWLDAVHKLDNSRLSGVAESLTRDESAQNLLAAIFGNSPYLTQVCIRYPGFLVDVLENGPDEAVAGLLARLETVDTGPGAGASLSTFLRETKLKMALAIGLADIASLWPLDRVTGLLSQLAQASLSRASAHVLQRAAHRGIIEIRHAHDPERDCGFIVLGMGKLGARELNYSSDIDLIVLFDPERIRSKDPATLQKHCIRMTRDIVKIMDERTAHGYVFRMDLRLRPDPGATPLAVSLQAAEVYYESQGQNWERAAMIKARPVAGDLEAGAEFLQWLRPFVWRKNLDFAAIQDIHSIKRQINAKRGGSTLNLAGHNIKLGRGGIREIEFFVQTQQLIWGGRIKTLREPSTISALNALVECGQVEQNTATHMIAAYEYLRTVEHRLQMMNDEQTQTLPTAPEDMHKFAVFMGYASTEQFAGVLGPFLRTVEDHYARLFEDAPVLTASGHISGNLVFTGSDTDPDTLETIAKLGFMNCGAVDQAIRAWHHGRYRAMRSTRAREMLTELTPALLQALGETPDPDNAFLKLDEFLAGLPAGVQLFSMLQSNPQLFSLLATILGEAPRLAELLSRRPSLFDGILTSDFLDPPPPLAGLCTRIETLLADAGHFEAALDISRRWVNDRKFQIGLQSLRGMLKPPEAAWTLSDTAEAAITTLFPVVEAEFNRQHGNIADSQFCIVALGKLGSHEMTPTSDLDMVFIYEVTSGDRPSDGAKPLMPTQYFARLGQRYINAISTPTSEGLLYEVDMRLRPSGKSGPIACTLEAFVQYHEENAWTWERMALTRARVLSGSARFQRAVTAAIRTTLIRAIDAHTLKADIADIRHRMDQEHHTENLWSIKHLRGGLVDLEFVVQYLMLRYAPEQPELLSSNTWRAIKNLEQARIITPDVAEILLQGLDLWQALQSRLHLSMETDVPFHGTQNMPVALQEKLASLGGADNVQDVEQVIQHTASRIFAVFEEFIGQPVENSTENNP